ncbi:hypothetical protein A2U01_0078688, partial [Trifolium medium]|nr:hypothetical protein [Trifolium medium]
MAPKRARQAGSSCSDHYFLDAAKKKHYEIIKGKWIVQERSIDFPNITFIPEMQQIADAYDWIRFNNMIGDNNYNWVEEFYANA